MRYVGKIIFKTIGNAGIVNGNVPVLRFGSNSLRVKISSTSTKRSSSKRTLWMHDIRADGTVWDTHDRCRGK